MIKVNLTKEQIERANLIRKEPGNHSQKCAVALALQDFFGIPVTVGFSSFMIEDGSKRKGCLDKFGVTLVAEFDSKCEVFPTEFGIEFC